MWEEDEGKNRGSRAMFRTDRMKDGRKSGKGKRKARRKEKKGWENKFRKITRSVASRKRPAIH